jgi:hypothetical protein
VNQKYDGPDKVPAKAIRKAYAKAGSVNFSARNFNHIKYRSIGIGDLGWWLPLQRVLPLIGITPQMLRPVFNPQQKLVKRGKEFKSIRVWLPKRVRTYDQLGSFPLSRESFLKLAKVLGKSIKVLREDGGTGDHNHIFTVHPSGEIVEAK